MRDDELHSTIASADRPRILDPTEQAAILATLEAGESTRLRQPTGSSESRGPLWMAIAASLVAVAAISAVTLRGPSVDQATVASTDSTQACGDAGSELVGTELSETLVEWRTIVDWAIAVSKPEPDLAEVASRTLREVLPDPDASTALVEIEALVATNGIFGQADVSGRERTMQRALAELVATVEADPSLCLAPGLADFID